MLITLEGIEGSGKSTQLPLLCRYLRQMHYDVLHVREPGGTRTGETLRKILLSNRNHNMSDRCEMLLYMAARAQLMAEKIIPALDTGKIVVCDRFLDATVAYQGYGCGVNIRLIMEIGKFATQDISPDLTLLFDIDVRKALRRCKHKDRIEKRSLLYHERVRKGYLELARKYSSRIKVVPADGPVPQIGKIVRQYVSGFLNG
jgi:dTMP kinase